MAGNADGSRRQQRGNLEELIYKHYNL